MTYDSEVLADTPWVYYKTDETSGAIADSSGNGRTATIPGGSPTYAQTGPSGSASDAMLWPDSSGATEYYLTRTTSIPAAAPFTLECWFYYSGTVPTNLTPLVGLAFGYGNTSQRPIEMYIGTDGKIKAITGQSSSVSNVISASSALTAGWHHAALLVATGAWKIRLDKVDVATSSTTVSFTSGATFFVHGGGSDGNATVGDLRNGSAITISKPALYSTKLSDARSDAHFDAMPQPVSATVTVPVATATAAGVVPAFANDQTITVPVATATASAPTPAVAGTGDATVVVPVAAATGVALVPSVAAGSMVIAPVALAAAAGVVPTVAATSSATVVAPVATASAAGVAPFVFNGSPDATVTVPVAEAVAAALAPGLGVGLGSDTSNVFNGRSRDGFATVVVTVPVVAPIATLPTRVDKAVPLPLPVLVKGRPT